MPQDQAAWYLLQILTGVKQRTSIDLYGVLVQKTADVSRFLYIESLLADNRRVSPCNLWIGDLIVAAGGCIDDFDYSNEDTVLTERGLRLLESVWTGDNIVSEL